MASFEVIDADGHITEEDGQLKKYMDSRYVNRAATFTPRDSWDRSLGGTLGHRAKDSKSWLEAMDKGRISTAILYPTNGLSVGWIREPDVAVAYAKAWNDFCSEEFQKVSPRLKCVALVPFQDVPEAVKELERAVKDLKLVGLMLPAVGLRLPLGHESYWPIYRKAQELDCMIGVHATVRGPPISTPAAAWPMPSWPRRFPCAHSCSRITTSIRCRRFSGSDSRRRRACISFTSRFPIRR